MCVCVGGRVMRKRLPALAKSQQREREKERKRERDGEVGRGVKRLLHTNAPTTQIMDGLSAALLALALGDYVCRNKKQDPRDETGQAGIHGIVDVEVDRGRELI